MTIWWNGKSSDDVNVVVEHYPDINVPRRKTEVTSVAGRNGDIIFEQDAFENVTKRYDIYISAEAPRLTTIAPRVVEWLMQKGYCRLEDGYEPDVFQLAYYSGGLDVQSILNRMGRCTIEFSAKPQKWLKCGEYGVTITNGMALFNPTPYDARPLIQATGNGTIACGGNALTISGNTGAVTIDCDTMDVYQGTINLNNKASGDFPILTGGANNIISVSGFTGVVVTPRWWRL